jgi:hypothetical protein
MQVSEQQFVAAMHALAAYVEGNIADLDAEQAHLDALLGRTQPGAEREED